MPISQLLYAPISFSIVKECEIHIHIFLMGAHHWISAYFRENTVLNQKYKGGRDPLKHPGSAGPPFGSKFR